MAKQVKRYVIAVTRPLSRLTYNSPPLTIEEAVKHFSYVLSCGAAYAHERGNKKVNETPKTIKSLITNLNNASHNYTCNGYGDSYEAVSEECWTCTKTALY